MENKIMAADKFENIANSDTITVPTYYTTDITIA